MLLFHIYDVFTDTAFAGNPLAVVEGADGLSVAQMQRLTRQFNLSETIFIQTPEHGGTAKVRIFFPAGEIPFAGHPTIGCAIHLAGDHADRIVLEEQAGDVPVTITRDGGGILAEFTAPLIPHRHPGKADPALVARAVDLDPGDFGTHPITGQHGGPAFLYVHLKDLDTLARARPIQPHWSAVLAAANAAENREIDALYLYTEVKGGYRSRLFSPTGGIPEDPATGSATALLAGHLRDAGVLTDGTTVLELAQGVEMGRPSSLRLSVDMTGGEITAVRVAGSAVKVMEGRTAVPPG